ncbi:hypothetical protein [Geobacillus thermoleovorans]|uniref:hypothetical protein n=1 Tax=Geobacillus thermoleovorans TaxID=33941 RepID=UPI0018D436C3|nr:hypothetical protein [Geobacillus thermoleovorans]
MAVNDPINNGLNDFKHLIRKKRHGCSRKKTMSPANEPNASRHPSSRRRATDSVIDVHLMDGGVIIFHPG